MTAPFLHVVAHAPAAASLAPWVTRVFALHGRDVPAEAMHCLPCDAALLHVHLAGNPELDRARGDRSFFTGIRPAPATHTVGGDFLTLFAVLTPAGAVALLEGAGIDGIDPCVPLSEVIGLDGARSLERTVGGASTPDAALPRLAQWLEARLVRRRAIPEAAWRAARVSCELSMAPGTKVVDAASRQAISQRQLERDMQRWLNVPPKQYALTAQFQRLLHVVGHEASLAGAAAEAGFADQAHMTRAVKKFSGKTPGELFRPAPGPVSASFRQASPGLRVFA